MRYGNCVLYAVYRFIQERKGHIAVGRSAHPYKIRVYYVSQDGVYEYFTPRHPRDDWTACYHAIWYEGKVRIGFTKHKT